MATHKYSKLREQMTPEARARVDARVRATLDDLPICHDYRPDHNGECLNCDEPADAHLPTKGEPDAE